MLLRNRWRSIVAVRTAPLRRVVATPSVRLVAGQVILVICAIGAYFGVRGLTEGDPAHADAHAGSVRAVERALGLDLETSFQRLVLDHDVVLDLANWTYIWLHWPVLLFTLVWLLRAHRDTYFVLRNAMFVSGAIGLLVYATFPVTPPRLLDPSFIDTVTQHSYSYRVLQPPAFVNLYAAMPSLHVGWNLLAAVMWWRVGRGRTWAVAAWVMPLAMAWATVATANHWVLDVLVGATVALTGLAIETWWRRRSDRRTEVTTGAGRTATPGTVAPACVGAGGRSGPSPAPGSRSPPFARW